MKKWSVDLPHITQRQKEIIQLIEKFRFLNRIQIQTLMNHKDYKRINVWLKDLVFKNYLQRIYEKKIPLNIKLAIYYIAPIGIRFLGGNKNLYREKYRSEEFRNRCLFIVDLYIDLLRKTKHLNALNFFHTKQDSFEYEEMIKPFPDLIVCLNKAPDNIIKLQDRKIKPARTKRKDSGKKDHTFLIEIIDDKTPRYYLRYRVKQYIEYFDSYRFKNSYLSVCLCLPNERTQKFMQRFIQQTLEETLFEPNLNFFLTLNSKLKGEGILGAIWTKPIKSNNP